MEKDKYHNFNILYAILAVGVTEKASSFITSSVRTTLILDTTVMGFITRDELEKVTKNGKS